MFWDLSLGESVHYDDPHVMGEVDRIVKAETFRPRFWKELCLFGHLPEERLVDRFVGIWDSIHIRNTVVQEQ
jgi:hypothetical protein